MKSCTARWMAALVLATAVGSLPLSAQTASPPGRAPSPSPGPPSQPQIAFPGQYIAAPSDWRYPVWPAGCARFSGEERIACLEFIANDYGRLSRYAGANAALAPRRPGETRVVFFGDSITDNWSKPGYGGFFAGKPYINRGIGGQTTSQMLLRFRRDAIALQPDAVVILAGTNDIAGNAGPVALEVVQQNLASMADLAKAHGIGVVLASLLPVSDDKTDRATGAPLVRTTNRPTETLRALNAWMDAFARRNGHVYLDYFSATADSSGRLRPELNDDGLHPSAAGYAVMAPLAEKAIAEALPARR
jgi:lysophospholipase L1-like esterase